MVKTKFLWLSFLVVIFSLVGMSFARATNSTLPYQQGYYHQENILNSGFEETTAGLSDDMATSWNMIYAWNEEWKRITYNGSTFAMCDTMNGGDNPTDPDWMHNDAQIPAGENVIEFDASGAATGGGSLYMKLGTAQVVWTINDDNWVWTHYQATLNTSAASQLYVGFYAEGDDRVYLDNVSVRSKTVDLSRPINTSIRINSNARTTKRRLVTLKLSATDSKSGVAFMRFSNNGRKWSGWKAYSTSYRNWDITKRTYGGTTRKGKKSVYVQFKDAAGNRSYTQKDSIYYR